MWWGYWCWLLLVIFTLVLNKYAAVVVFPVGLCQVQRLDVSAATLLAGATLPAGVAHHLRLTECSTERGAVERRGKGGAVAARLLASLTFVYCCCCFVLQVNAGRELATCFAAICLRARPVYTQMSACIAYTTLGGVTSECMMQISTPQKRIMHYRKSTVLSCTLEKPVHYRNQCTTARTAEATQCTAHDIPPSPPCPPAPPCPPCPPCFP